MCVKIRSLILFGALSILLMVSAEADNNVIFQVKPQPNNNLEQFIFSWKLFSQFYGCLQNKTVQLCRVGYNLTALPTLQAINVNSSLQSSTSNALKLFSCWKNESMNAVDCTRTSLTNGICQTNMYFGFELTSNQTFNECVGLVWKDEENGIVSASLNCLSPCNITCNDPVHSSNATRTSGNDNNNTTVIVSVTVIILIVLIIAAVIIVWKWKSRVRKQNESNSLHQINISAPSSGRVQSNMIQTQPHSTDNTPSLSSAESGHDVVTTLDNDGSAQKVMLNTSIKIIPAIDGRNELNPGKIPDTATDKYDAQKIQNNACICFKEESGLVDEYSTIDCNDETGQGLNSNGDYSQIDPEYDTIQESKPVNDQENNNEYEYTKPYDDIETEGSKDQITRPQARAAAEIRDANCSSDDEFDSSHLTEKKLAIKKTGISFGEEIYLSRNPSNSLLHSKDLAKSREERDMANTYAMASGIDCLNEDQEIYKTNNIYSKLGEKARVMRNPYDKFLQAEEDDLTEKRTNPSF